MFKLLGGLALIGTHIVTGAISAGCVAGGVACDAAKATAELTGAMIETGATVAKDVTGEIVKKALGQ